MAEDCLTVEELPKFTPTFDGGGNALVVDNTKYTDTTLGFGVGTLWDGMRKTNRASLNSIGNDGPHTNIAPVVAGYCWKRTL